MLLLLLLVFSTQVLAASVNLAWDPVTSGSLRGYMVYYGPALGGPLTNPVQGADIKVDVGSNTITVTHKGEGGLVEKTFTLAKDARIDGKLGMPSSGRIVRSATAARIPPKRPAE